MKRENADKFVESLIALSDNNGAMAKLRRGESGSLSNRIDRYNAISGLMGPEEYRNLKMCCFIGTLFAIHPKHTSQEVSFGRAMKQAASHFGDQLNRRFSYMLTVNRKDALPHIMNFTRMLKSKGIALNYAKLLADLTYWNVLTKTVQDRWAKDYFFTMSKE